MCSKATDRTLAVRRRRPGDSELLAEVFARSFERPLADDVDAAALWAVSERDHLLRGAEFAVAVDGDVPVGMVAWVDGNADAPKGAGEVEALYVIPELHGSGVGQALHDTAVSALRADGKRLAVLWVIQWNARAKAFYTKNGWSADGVAVQSSVQGVPIVLERWSKRLR